MSGATFVVSTRAIRYALAGVAVLLLIGVLALVPGPRQALALAIAPRTVANSAALESQRVATERAIQRGYAKALDQLRQVGELTLAIPRSEADAIDRKARDDLRQIRRDALSALGQLVGLGGPSLSTYVPAAEGRLDVGSFEGEPGVLLAPDLFSLVRRAGELFQQRADSATRELTRAPSTPSPSGRPSASPSATAGR